MNSQPHRHLYASVVRAGDQSGRTIGFPTVNLDPQVLPASIQQGVYAARVEVEESWLHGALYLGPRYSHAETHTVLEIHILDFSGNVYGKPVRFTLEQYIRPPLKLNSLDAVREQLKQDTAAVRTFFLENSSAA